MYSQIRTKASLTHQYSGTLVPTRMPQKNGQSQYKISQHKKVTLLRVNFTSDACKKVFKSYCLPMLSLLACVYLLLFLRGATKCTAEQSSLKLNELHCSLVNCLHLRRKAVRILCYLFWSNCEVFSTSMASHKGGIQSNQTPPFLLMCSCIVWGAVDSLPKC